MTEQQPLNITIADGEPFFSHEMSVNFNPTQFILDFKCITPRNDARSKNRPVFFIKHNVVMVEPWHAKSVYEVLGKVLESYEKEFGKISKPKSVQKAEKKFNSQEPVKADIPQYLG